MTAEEAMSPKSAESPKVKKKKKPSSDADAEKRGRRRRRDSSVCDTPKTPASVGSMSRRKKLDLGEDGMETLKRSVKKIGDDRSVSRTPTTIKKKKKSVTADRDESSTEMKARSASVDSISSGRKKPDLGEDRTETLKRRVKKIGDDGSVSRTPTTIKKKKIHVKADGKESAKEERARSASVNSISSKRKLDLGKDGTETLKRNVKKIGDDGSVSRTPATIKETKFRVIADGQEYSTEMKDRSAKARSASVGSTRRRKVKKIGDNGSVSRTPASIKKKKISVPADREESSTEKKDQRTKEEQSSRKSSSEDPDEPVEKKKLRSTSLERKEKVPVESDDSVYSDDGKGYKNSSAYFDIIWDDRSTRDFRQSSAAASSSLSPTPRHQPKVTPPSQARVSEISGAFSTVGKEAEQKDASTLGHGGSQLKSENTTLQVKVQEQEDLICTLKKEREKELSKFSKTMSDLLELKATHIDTENQSGELRKKSGKLESTLVTKNKHISALESASIDQTDRIRQLEREVGFAKQDVIRLKSGQQRVKDPADKETAKKTQEDLEDLRNELAEVQAILAERDEKIGALEKARVDQMDLVEDLENELDYAEDDIFRLEEEESEKRSIAPQNRNSGALAEKARQLDEWELDLIERETQFDEERKAQDEKFAHMLDLVDYEKELEDGAKKLVSEEASLDKCARDLAAKEKCLVDKEKVLDEKQLKLGVLENKLNGEKETVKRKSMQVTPFLASQAALKKQNERGLGSEDDATIAQLRDEIEKLKEENERVKKDGSKDMIEKQHEEALQTLQIANNEEMRHHFEEKHALQTQLEEEQVLAEEKLRDKDASIEFIQREMEELKEELEELLREEAERGQQETQIDALMEENELLQDQLEEEREESGEQLSAMTEAVERLQELNRELDEKIEAEAVKNKDMIIMDLQIEINELNITLEKQNTNEYAAKLRQEVKQLKTELKNLKTEFQDKETGAYRNIQARDEAIHMLQKEVDRVYLELGIPVGTFALDLPAPAPPPSRVVEPSGFFGMLMGS
jgi:hypothetical protein